MEWIESFFMWTTIISTALFIPFAIWTIRDAVKHWGGRMSGIDTPLMRYPGAKFRLRKWYHSFFAPHKVYTEPFCGTASLLFYKKPAITEVINDTNYDVVNLFRVLRDRDKSNQLEELVRLTPYAREEYELCWDPADNEIEKARRFLMRVSMGQRGKLTKSGFDTRVNTDSYSGRVNYLSELHESISLFTDRLKKVIVEYKDGIEIIRQFDSDVTLQFVDPEYLNVKKGYPDKFTLEDHFKLSRVLNECNGMIILCGYPSEEYKEWYEDKGWTMHQSKAYADGGYKRTECVWLNPVLSQKQKQQTLFSHE